VDDGGCAKEVASRFPIEIAIKEDVREGVSAAAVWAGGGITSRGSEMVRIGGVEGVTGDELETRRLEGPGLCKENASGERREYRGGVVVKSGVEATRVLALKPWAFRRPLRKHTVFGGERWGPGEREVCGLFPERGDPVHLVCPCPSLGEMLPCNKDVRYLENVCEDVKEGVG